MKQPFIYYSSDKTLKSFGLTNHEFYALLNPELSCSGIRHAYKHVDSSNCSGVYCHDCPLSKLRTDRERKIWLGLITESGHTITEELKPTTEPFFETIHPPHFSLSEFDKKTTFPKPIKPVKEKTLEERMTILENKNKGYET